MNAPRGPHQSVSTDDLAFLPALEQARLVRQREVSPVELVQTYLQRIERLDPTLNSYITVVGDQAIATARAAEAVAGQAETSPLHGVPVSIRDLHLTAGIKTSFGIHQMRNFVPPVDDTAVAKLRSAGLVILGKTAAPAIGQGCVTEPVGFLPCRNPWDTDRTPRGSSGGAGAALAGGLCALSEGSDGGGSIRIPSAWCGLVGVKPSRGRVSTAPAPSNLLAAHGPMAHTVSDAAAMLDIMSGPVLGDAYWAPPPDRSFLKEVSIPPGRLRIAVSLGGSDVAPAIRAALEATVLLLTELGHDVVEADPDPTWSRLFEEIIDAMAGPGTEMVVKSLGLEPGPDLDPIVMGMVLMGRDVTANDYVAADANMMRRARQVTEFFSDYDLLLSPTTAKPPPHIGEHRELSVRELFLAWERYVPFTTMWNATGQPAISVPSGLDDQGSPSGCSSWVAPQTRRRSSGWRASSRRRGHGRSTTRGCQISQSDDSNKRTRMRTFEIMSVFASQVQDGRGAAPEREHSPAVARSNHSRSSLMPELHTCSGAPPAAKHLSARNNTADNSPRIVQGWEVQP
ncbi:MAG: amidase [Candidatus Dormibacteria bacterium]